ncbi:MAG TPA: hypothetical protein VFG85_08540, partial [Gaiellaceae bacterium]|nr:hypothetical protein [Gaiellaceae bacterium]
RDDGTRATRSPTRARDAPRPVARGAGGADPDFGERVSLRVTLADEILCGRVLLIGDRYVLNGGLDEETKRALLDLALADDRR